MRMRAMAWVLIGVLVAAGSGCGDNDGVPPPPPGIAGWVVGSAVDGQGMILNTTNGGASWERQTRGVPDANFGGASAADQFHAWVVGRAADESGIILRTSDGGFTWVQQGILGAVFPNLNGVSAVDANTAWIVGGEGKIYHTTNAGLSWVPQQSGVTTELLTVGAVDANVAWVSGVRNDGSATILRTTDGGLTWIRRGAGVLPDKDTRIGAVSADVAWAAGQSATVLRTTDGGATWQVFTVGVFDANGACAFDANTAWIAADQGAMFYTTDGGTSWDSRPLDFSGGAGFELLRVSAMPDGNLWVVGPNAQGEMTGVIGVSDSTGLNWTDQTPAPPNNPDLFDVTIVGACQ